MHAHTRASLCVPVLMPTPTYAQAHVRMHADAHTHTCLPPQHGHVHNQRNARTYPRTNACAPAHSCTKPRTHEPTYACMLQHTYENAHLHTHACTLCAGALSACIHARTHTGLRARALSRTHPRRNARTYHARTHACALARSCTPPRTHERAHVQRMHAHCAPAHGLHAPNSPIHACVPKRGHLRTPV